MARNKAKQDYRPVEPSPWPIIGAAGTFFAVIGAVFWMHGTYNFFGLGLGGNPTIFFTGIALIVYTLMGWRFDFAKEANEPGRHGHRVQLNFRYAVPLLLCAEAMFFSAWIWVYFNAAIFHSGYPDGTWSPQTIINFGPWGLPLFNTLLLLTSCTTIFWARHSIISGDHRGAANGLALTIILGAAFIAIRTFEYVYAPFAFGLIGEQLLSPTDTGDAQGDLGAIYGSTFFMLMGLHTTHIAVGVVFLVGCLRRILAGQYTPQRYFGFEAAAWYWYFGVVIWLVLFACIYVWGAGHGAAAPIEL
nr:MAG: cytochrome c oxidase subunit 3 [Hyphomicrobiales bacterium]